MAGIIWVEVAENWIECQKHHEQFSADSTCTGCVQEIMDSEEIRFPEQSKEGCFGDSSE